MLLLHGYSDSADTWRPLLDELAERGQRALAVDMPGYGDADPLNPDEPILSQLDRFVAELVREQAAEHGPPLIVGNSLGGVVGLRATQEPQLPLAGLVGVSPAGLGHQPWVELLAREPILHRIAQAPVPLPMNLVRWGVGIAYRRLAVADPARADPVPMNAYTSRYRSSEDVRETIRGARRILGEIQTAYELDRVQRPVLLIWGKRDLLTPAKGARILVEAVPGTELVLLDDCAHCAQVEDPARVAELVCDFARRVTSEA